MSEAATCAICGQPMPEGEEMFNYHGYSGPCPAPALPRESTPEERKHRRLYDILAGINDAIEVGDDGYARFASLNDRDRLRDVVRELEPEALAIHEREAQREARLAKVEDAT